MTAYIKYLSQIANDIFERQMSRAATRISARQHLFPNHAA
jgi:hypothetical protein